MSFALPGFNLRAVETGETQIAIAEAGAGGRPLLLLHGHPQTKATWHRVAPTLVEAGFHVVLADLRGYGDSGRPADTDAHATYGKRAMARDQIATMRALGHDRFAVVGHDRGARVAHRLALDHPASVERVVMIDAVPTQSMYERTDQDFATRYFWWFFLIQPAPLPETLIGRDPAFYLERHIAGQLKTPGATTPEIFTEYLRCYTRPGTIHAICEDYRAGATLDLAEHRADRAAGRRIAAPLLALWGARGSLPRLFDIPTEWRRDASDVRGEALDCGHTLQEEAPGALLAALLPFLTE